MKPHILTRVMSLGLVLIGPAATYAAEPSTPPPAVPYFAATCANCHGTNGFTQTGINLAGREASLLKELLFGYKTGTRQGTIMHQHAKGYTDEEIAILADYFSKQKK